MAKEAGRPLDVHSVFDAARSDNYELDRASMNRLIDDAFISHGHLAPSIEIVKDSALRRDAVLFFKRAFTEMQDAETAREKLNEIQTELTTLQAEQVSRSSQVHHITHHREDKVDQWRKAKSVGFVGLPSSIKEIDHALGGYRRKVMCIIGGYRGEGKSLFMRQELYSMATKGFKTLLVTLEDPEDMAAAVVAGHAARSSVFSLDVGTATPFKIDAINETWAGMKGLPMWTASARTIEDITTICMAHKARYGLDVIGIDHIQYINPYVRPRLDRNGTIALYSNAICNLLKDTDAAGLVASQFGRSAERDGRRPRLSDLRDSGTIEQDCRQALLLSRDPLGHILEVAKNNFGPSGLDIGLARIGAEHRFEFRQLQEKKESDEI
jgi:replicative DNA helicase